MNLGTDVDNKPFQNRISGQQYLSGEEMLFLFGLGLSFGAFFRLTKNVFVLWPFYTPVGSIFTNLREGLTLPFEATYGFLLTIGLMVGIIVWASIYHTKEQRS